MSKRTLLIIALAAFLLPFIVGGGLMVAFPDWRPFGDPVFTETIPTKRPPRLDRRLVEQHAGKPIVEAIAAMRTIREAALAKDPSLAPSKPAPALLAMLPDAPLPFPADAVPRDEAGLKAFITTMKATPEAGPSTPEERWEFNLALAALGVKPADIPEAIRLQTRPTPESDTYPVRLLPRTADLAGPLALGDFDGQDGAEIVAAGGTALYQIGSGGMLVALDGLAGQEPGDGLHPGDFDGDGDLDLYVTRRHGLPDSLLRNDGKGIFTDETVALGLLAFRDTTAAAWIDYDQDGRLDLLVGSLDQPLELYHQTSAGTFQAIAWDLKLWVPRGILHLAVADVNEDGFPDFFLARDTGKNQLLLSQTSANWSDWRFAPADGVFGFPADAPVSAALFFDADNDARSDLLLASRPTDPAAGSLRLYHNEGGGAFSDVTEASGLTRGEAVLSLAAADLDLDGYDDLLLGTPALSLNRVFANQGGLGFRPVTVAVQGGHLDETVAWVTSDLEGNGSADLLAVKGDGGIRWLEATGSTEPWVRLALPGQREGTRLVVTSRDRDWVAHTVTRRLGLEPLVTLGLAGGESIERLEIFPAAGTEAIKTIEGLAPNQLHVITLPKQPLPRAVVPVTAPGGAAEQEAAPAK